jgi:iron complex transport system substrate-binding protein
VPGKAVPATDRRAPTLGISNDADQRCQVISIRQRSGRVAPLFGDLTAGWRSALLLAIWGAVCLLVPLRAAVPERIVSTSPSVTETLFALGLGERVVGVSTYCRYPDAVTKLPRVGTFLRPDAELIAKLRPDLVIVHAGPHDVVRQLDALRIRTATVDRGTLPSVYSSIRAIGSAAGIGDRAEMLVGDLQRHLDRVRSAVAGRARKRVLVIVGRRAGTLTDLVAVGSGSYLSDLVEIAGGTNVLAGGGLPEYPRISMETVIRLAPDVIVDAGDMGDTPADRARREAATLGAWTRQTAVAAVRERGIHPVMSDAFVVPGPRVVEVADTLARWLHGVDVRQ